MNNHIVEMRQHTLFRMRVSLAAYKAELKHFEDFEDTPAVIHHLNQALYHIKYMFKALEEQKDDE